MEEKTQDAEVANAGKAASMFDDRALRILGVALLMTAFLGLAPTLLLVKQSNALAVNKGARSRVCEAIGPSCAGALTSGDAKIGPLTLSYMGFGWYAGLSAFMAVSLLGARSRVGWPGLPWTIIAAMAGCGSLAMAAMLIVKLLNSTTYDPCPLCMVTHCVTIVFGFLSIIAALLALWKSSRYCKRSESAEQRSDSEIGAAAEAYLLVGILMAFSVAIVAMLGAEHRETRMVRDKLAMELKALHDDPVVADAIFFSNAKEMPEETQAAIGSAPMPFLGDPEAPVAMIVAFDFKCSHCREHFFKFEKLLPDYLDYVRLEFMHFPISNLCNPKIKIEGSPISCRAHLASIAAENQGKFHEYAELLFERQRDLDEEMLLKIAEELELDMETFEKDMASDETLLRLKRDILIGNDLKLTGTPRFIVEGTILPKGISAKKAFEEAAKRAQ